MKICARAPVRIDPAGGGTDAPPYSVEYGGCVVNISVARYSYAQLQWLEPGAGAHVYSLDLNLGASAPTLDELKRGGKLGFVKGFAKRLLNGRDDFLLVTQSDIPVRTGLGGSGAMGVAITTACLKATRREMSQADLAQLANDIEREDLGLAGGNQDSFGGAIGGAKRIVLHQGGGTTCTRLNLPSGVAERLERDMLLIYTGGIHLSATIHEDIKRSYAMENSPTIAALDRLKSAAERMADALERGDIDGFVAMLNESRKSHYALHSSCDSEVLRKFFATLDPFIVGGKTCGAGGGGFIAVVTKPGCKNACAEAAAALGGQVWPFIMDHRGAIAWEEAPWMAGEVASFQALSREHPAPALSATAGTASH
jgi:D-glycero-alpha-D-manno-heptose-7-phosphate kinase